MPVKLNDETKDSEPSDGQSRRSVIRRALNFLDHPWVTICSLVIVALVAKAWIMQPAALGSIWVPVLRHDALIFSAVLVACAAATIFARRPGTARVVLFRAAMIAVLFVIAVYVADSFVYWFFVTRLYIADLVTFAGEISAAYSLLKTGYWIASKEPLWKSLLALSLALILIRSVYRILAARAPQIGSARALAIGAVGFAGLAVVPLPGSEQFYGDKPLFENVFQRNIGYLNRADYSQEFIEKLKETKAPPSVCKAGEAKRLNIVVVLVESLSSYHSRFFSGIEDWTPVLDRIAGEGTALLNFHANGWTTIGGMLPLLSGAMPVVPQDSAFTKWGGARFESFRDMPRPLARKLASLGYSTAYVAAGDLGFVGKGKWLKQTGFERVVGDEDPRMLYRGVRGPFNSVPDRLLYQVANDELGSLKSRGRPYFLVIQTYWSHRPFLTPDGEKLNGEEPVIREADAQLGAFVESLRADGFFDSGLLFITGDHRAMEPFRKEEGKRFGASKVSRIPGVIVTDAVELPKTIAEDFQLRDFPVSVEALVSERYCIGQLEGSFLGSQSVPSRCILHARGDDRDLVYVKCGGEEGTIRIAGDETRLESGNISNAGEVIEFINRSRIGVVTQVTGRD